MYSELRTPAVIVDLDAADANIEQMATRLSEQNIAHRPHVKTHKSIHFAKKQRDAGAHGITVAKLSEAEVFASAGFDDILAAYSLVGEDKWARYEVLHERIQMTTTVDSLFVARGLSAVGARTGKPVRVLIEIDGGTHRGGRQPGQDALDFARELQQLPGLELLGLFVYAGDIYAETSQEGILRAVERESADFEETVALFEAAGIAPAVLSGGSTPGARYSARMRTVNEVRAGNYIFYDATAVALGVATEAQCALRVIATVVATPLPGRATIDAGSKTLTSDLCRHRQGYGQVVGHPSVSITKLNEEHGFLEFDPAVTKFEIGDRIEIIPNHSCVVVNLNDTLYGVQNGRLVETIRVDARGCKD